MCQERITHQFYNACRRGQRGGPYHWFPAVWSEECGVLNCGGVSLDDPFIFWCSTECPGCESGESSARFWQVNGKPEYGLPPMPRLDDMFDTLGAPARYARSVHSSRTESPPPSVSVASSQSSDGHRTPRQSDASQSGQPSRSRVSEAGSHSSQLSFGTQFINSFEPGEWDQFMNDFEMEDMDSYINGFLDPVPEAISDASPVSYHERTQSNQSRSQSRSNHNGSRTSSRASEATPPSSQAQNSEATTPKACLENIQDYPRTQSRSSRAATPMEYTLGPEYIANVQISSSSKPRASKQPPVYAGKHLDPPKALRSGKRY